jgi:hypothetical protein
MDVSEYVFWTALASADRIEMGIGCMYMESTAKRTWVKVSYPKQQQCTLHNS